MVSVRSGFLNYARSGGWLSTAMMGGLWLAVIALGTASQPAVATESRLVALGGAGDYIEDDRNVRRWYGSLLDYPDVVTVDSGYFGVDGYSRQGGRRLSGPALGVHYQIDWSETQMVCGGFLDNRDHLGLAGRLASETRLSGTKQYLVGLRFGTWQAVAGFVADTTDKTTGGGALPLVQTGYAQTDLCFGVRFDASDRMYLDLAGEVRRYRHTNQTSGVPGNWDSGDRVSWRNIGLRARAFYELGERTALVPVVEYLSEDRPEITSLPYVNQDLSGDLWRFGCGLNFLPDLDSLVFLFAEYLTSGVDHLRQAHSSNPVTLYHYTHEWQVVNVRLGLEKRFQSWLSLRASTGYRVVDEDSADWTTDPDMVLDPTSSREKMIPVSIGLAGHLGSWDLDAAVTSNLPAPSPLSLPSSVYADPDQGTWVSLTLAYRFSD